MEDGREQLAVSTNAFKDNALNKQRSLSFPQANGGGAAQSFD